MTNISYNIFASDDIEVENNIVSIIISSEIDDGNIFTIFMEIIRKIFAGNSFIFKAVGLPENINAVMLDLEQYNIHYHKGDSNRFFIKRYPECIVNIDEKGLKKALTDCWSNAVYERRYIYILDAKYTETLMNELDEYKYFAIQSQGKAYQYVHAVIENAPDCNTNSFILRFRETFRESIVNLLDNISI